MARCFSARAQAHPAESASAAALRAKRSEEHTSEPSHLVISDAVFCLEKKSGTVSLLQWRLAAVEPPAPPPFCFFFNDPATTAIYTLSLHGRSSDLQRGARLKSILPGERRIGERRLKWRAVFPRALKRILQSQLQRRRSGRRDRKSTRLNPVTL